MFIQELCDRYKIKSRKSLYSRLEGLGITLDKEGKKSYATEKQIALLDQQNEHIKNGGTIKNFVPTTHAEVTVHDTTTQHSQDNDISGIVETTVYAERYPLGHSTQLEVTPKLLGDIVQAVSSAIALKMTPSDPVWYIEKLELLRVTGVKIPTSQVKALIGVKPTLKGGKKDYRRGSYIYIPDGKIGNERAWRVMRETDNQATYNVSK